MIDQTELDGLRHTVATGCRILAHQGLAEDILGHISVRISAGSALVRCRGPRERGLLFTTPTDIRLVDLTDDSTDDPDYSAPNELPIHTSVLSARADVKAVVHAHPPWVVATDLADLPLLPMVGAYNIPAARMAADGIPVYPRGVLIRRRQLGDEMTECLGDAPACVLRGHGITTVGSSVEQAVVRALAINSLARMTARVKALGGEVAGLPDDDLAELPDLGGGFNDTLVWQHHCERLAHEGLAIPIAQKGQP